MSKTKEELNAIKEEVESLNEKLQELSKEELEQVSGGVESYALIGKFVFEPVDNDPELYHME